METEEKLTVYYDGACHLCSREIDHYRSTDDKCRLDLVDISQPGFDAEAAGLDPDNVEKVFHVKDGDGNIITGVDAFQKIWQTIDTFPLLSKLADNRLSRKGMDMGYNIFAKLRPLLPKKKIKDDILSK